MKTKRQRIVDAVVARMQSIRVANGYQSDAGALVEDSPQRFDESDLVEQPSRCALGVYDLPDEVSKESKHSKGATHRMRVQVRVFKSLSVTPAEMRVILGDVVAAVGTDVTRPELYGLLWPDETGKYLAIDTEPAQEGLLMPEQALETFAAAVEVTIVYATALFDPYQ